MLDIGLDLRFWRSGTGGIGRYSRNLLKELLVLDTENRYTAIITPEDQAEFSLNAPNLRKLVVPISHFSLSEQRQLPKILNQQNFDLVHFANFNHPILYRRPFVVTVHDMIMHLFPGAVQRKSLLHRWAYKKVFNDCQRAEKIIVPSQSTKQDLVEKLGFSASKIVITPEGNEVGFRVHSATEIAAIKQKLGLPEHFLLFVSRWERYKGLPALLEAHRLLAKDNPALGLVICGKPDSQNPEIAQMVQDSQRENKNIITPGFVSDEDLSVLYSAASVYVHPSWYEGFGIMILEAFASGTPVVTSNVSSLPEVVGEAGLLVDPHQPAEIAKAIQRILGDPQLAADLRSKGLERVKQYSWKKMAEQTLAIYRQAGL